MSLKYEPAWWGPDLSLLEDLFELKKALLVRALRQLPQLVYRPARYLVCEARRLLYPSTQGTAHRLLYLST